jgi:formamidopyrimidine-DNA glycosylase
LYVMRDPLQVPGIATLGPDPLDPAFDVVALTRILDGSRQQIKGLLRDQSVLAGVGNAYSDEVLHAAKLSPYAVAGKLGEGEVERLWTAMRTVLTDAVEAAAGKPAKELKDAKRAGMRVHGRAGLPCPVCGDTVREVSFADRALQYCPTCQTGGKVLADRRLSRLLK